MTLDLQRKLSREYSVVEVEEDSEEEEEADLAGEANKGDEVVSPAVDSFRCIMCEKVFRHADNLKVHLQSHLGTRAKLNSCGLCRDGRNHDVYTSFDFVSIINNSKPAKWIKV